MSRGGIDALLRIALAARAAPRLWSALLRAQGSPEGLLDQTDRSLSAAGVSGRVLQRLRRDAVPQGWRDWLAEPRHHLLAITDPAYPERLAAMSDAPPVLWIQGTDLARLATPQLAIVGSRHATRSGLDTARAFSRALSGCGLTITSGLAIGIDAASHEAALDQPGGTIAILGSGIDTVYPREHLGLAREIAAAGLVVSEYAPGVAPRPLHFPQRNRIIAGLSLGTLVVEATRRSGSLITARIANDAGREIFAVPGSIHNPLARGCHALLRQGAMLVEDPGEILAALAPIIGPMRTGLPDTEKPACAVPRCAAPPAAAAAQLLEHLDFEPVLFDTLVDRAGLTAAELSSMLLVLELEGFVEALPGGRYCRRAKRGR